MKTAAEFIAARYERAVESLDASRRALDRNRGNLTEQDWKLAVEACEARVLAIESEGEAAERRAS